MVNASPSKEVQRVERQLQRVVRSATRSDRLSAELLVCGLDGARIAEVLEGALEASLIQHKTKYNPEKKRVEPIDDEVPDWKTRMAAVKMLADIHGWIFQLPKQDVSVDNRVLILAKDVYDTKPADLIARRAANKKIIDTIPPEALAEFEAAEVVE